MSENFLKFGINDGLKISSCGIIHVIHISVLNFCKALWKLNDVEKSQQKIYSLNCLENGIYLKLPGIAMAVTGPQLP